MAARAASAIAQDRPMVPENRRRRRVCRGLPRAGAIFRREQRHSKWAALLNGGFKKVSTIIRPAQVQFI
jgi:hypothetical protein